MVIDTVIRRPVTLLPILVESTILIHTTPVLEVGQMPLEGIQYEAAVEAFQFGRMLNANYIMT
jgi:hypothetical protein